MLYFSVLYYFTNGVTHIMKCDLSVYSNDALIKPCIKFLFTRYDISVLSQLNIVKCRLDFLFTYRYTCADMHGANRLP